MQENGARRETYDEFIRSIEDPSVDPARQPYSAAIEVSMRHGVELMELSERQFLHLLMKTCFKRHAQLTWRRKNAFHRTRVATAEALQRQSVMFDECEARAVSTFFKSTVNELYMTDCALRTLKRDRDDWSV